MSSSDTIPEGEYYNGTDDYPVFPHARYISKFYKVSSQYAGLTKLDIALYNRCYLPYNPLSDAFAIDSKFKRDIEIDVEIPDDNDPNQTNSNAPRPTYLINEPPCKRTAAINSNCYFDNTNGTFSGLQLYEDKFEVQQQCYCEKYPYFDSAFGCNECFKLHGGIEGYHWFPDSYMNAVSSSYCNADPATTGFYPFYHQWMQTDPAATVPSTTAPDILGTEAAASLYYTYAAAASITSAASSTRRKGVNFSKLGLWISLMMVAGLGAL
ncbi:hypothetical protein ABW19_dt0200604 [Dactylella cylindrospora]|nr:hypothetical protein ABW19_dt0200604 [Dactylella cylindrospora]